jgi:hypothetical protein
MEIGGGHKVAHGRRLGLLENRALEIRKRLKLSGVPPPALGNAPARDARAQRRKVEGFERALVGERYVFRLWRMN